MEKKSLTSMEELRSKDFNENGGGGLLRRYGGAPKRIIESLKEEEEEEEEEEGEEEGKRGEREGDEVRIGSEKGYTPRHYWVPSLLLPFPLSLSLLFHSLFSPPFPFLSFGLNLYAYVGVIGKSALGVESSRPPLPTP